MIHLYHYPISPCSEKVRYALALKEMDWGEKILDLAAKENLSDDFLVLNPAGCIPVLVHGTDVINESTVILEYLEALKPNPGLTPSGPMDRARMRHWAKRVDEFLHPAWPGIAWVVLVRPKWIELGEEVVHKMVQALPDQGRRKRQLALYESGFASTQSRIAIDKMNHVLTDMATELAARPYLGGNTPGIADISVLPYCTALAAFGLLSEPLFEITPIVTDWYTRMTTLPALEPVLRSQVTAERAKSIRATGQEALQALN